MSEQDQSHRPPVKNEADQTLLGVAPPRIDESAESLQRAPVYVRSGTALADAPSVPASRTEPAIDPVPVVAGRSQVPTALAAAGSSSAARRALELARQRPVLWMALTPALLACLAIAFAGRTHPHASLAPVDNAPATPASAPAVAPAVEGDRIAPSSIAELEAKPASSLSAREVLLLAGARADRELAAASALRRKIELDPALAKDTATRNELLRLSVDDRTARDALAAMAALDAPIAADLLYETWTGTAQRSEVTELARALLYSSDVRPKASPALAVALELRVAESCEQYQAALPNALKDGDRRSLHLLTKLSAKRGCGPKKAADCFACLRAHGDELNATINAVKSRHAPSYGAP